MPKLHIYSLIKINYCSQATYSMRCDWARFQSEVSLFSLASAQTMAAIDFKKMCIFFYLVASYISMHTLLKRSMHLICAPPSHTLIWTRTPTLPCQEHSSMH